MAIKGYKSPLENKDLWSLNKEDSSEVVVPKLLREWEVEKSKLQRYAEAHSCEWMCLSVHSLDTDTDTDTDSTPYSLPCLIVLEPRTEISIIGNVLK